MQLGNIGNRGLLAVDCVINLLLGGLLLLTPAGIAEVLGLPATGVGFYPTILGAVLFGIGLALAVETGRSPASAQGLGLTGAIAINLCGGLALLAWLLFGDLQIALRGQVVLWTICVLVLAISVAELYQRAMQSQS
jgi:hypothetical protein